MALEDEEDSELKGPVVRTQRLLLIDLLATVHTVLTRYSFSRLIDAALVAIKRG